MPFPVAAGDPREIEAAPASEDFVKGGGRPWRVEARKSLPRQGPEHREQTRTGPWSTDAWRCPGGAEVGWVSKDEQDRRAGVPRPRARKQTRLPSLQRAGADGHAWAGGPGDRGCGLQTRSPARRRSSAPCSGPSASARSSRQPRVRVGTWLPRGRGHPQEPLPGAAGQGSAVGRDTGLFRPRPLPSSAGNGPACHGGGVSRQGPPSSAGPRSGSPVPLAHPHSPLVCVCVCVPGGRGGGDEACALPVAERRRRSEACFCCLGDGVPEAPLVPSSRSGGSGRAGPGLGPSAGDVSLPGTAFVPERTPGWSRRSPAPLRQAGPGVWARPRGPRLTGRALVLGVVEAAPLVRSPAEGGRGPLGLPALPG